MELKPCPFCKNGKTEIRPQTYWTGMRYNTMSYNLIHWCDGHEDLYTNMTITIRAKTEEEIVRVWNGH